MRTPFPFANRAICAFAFLVSFTSCEKKDAFPAVDQSFAPNFTLAKTNSELAAIQANPAANIVRTRQDLDALISASKSPLTKLTAAERADFVSKLVFRKNVGVVSFYYGGIASKLSYDDVAQVVAAFGLDAKRGFWGLSRDRAINRQLQAGGTTGGLGSFADEGGDQLEEEQTDGNDYKGYFCWNKGNCRIAKGWICMSGC